MNLTNNFTLEEMCKTSTGIDNTPTPEVISNLTALCSNVLQPLRSKYGKPIIVNSGYRCHAVNKKVGGVATSQHLKGEAADITAGNKAENRKLFELLDALTFDQAIWEQGGKWIHVSYKAAGNRKQKLNL